MEYSKLVVPTIISILISMFFVTDFVFGQPEQNTNFTTFSNFTNLTSLMGNQTTPFSINQNGTLTFAANQTGTFNVRPSNTFPGSEAFYAFHIQLDNPNREEVARLVIHTSGGFDTSNAQILKADGNLKLVAEDGTLSFMFDPPTTATRINQDILVDGIINTVNTGESGFLLTAGKPEGGFASIPALFTLKNFPSNSITSNQLAEDSVGYSELRDNSVGSSTLGQNSVGARELKDISKILYFQCGIKTANRIVSSNVKDYDPGGLKPSLPEVLAKCITPGVEEGDIVLTPLTGGPTRGGGELIPYYLNANNGSIDIHWRNLGQIDLPAGEPVGFSAFVIKVD